MCIRNWRIGSPGNDYYYLRFYIGELADYDESRGQKRERRQKETIQKLNHIAV